MSAGGTLEESLEPFMFILCSVLITATNMLIALPFAFFFFDSLLVVMLSLNQDQRSDRMDSLNDTKIYPTGQWLLLFVVYFTLEF